MKLPPGPSRARALAAPLARPDQFYFAEEGGSKVVETRDGEHRHVRRQRRFAIQRHEVSILRRVFVEVERLDVQPRSGIRTFLDLEHVAVGGSAYVGTPRAASSFLKNLIAASVVGLRRSKLFTRRESRDRVIVVIQHAVPDCRSDCRRARLRSFRQIAHQEHDLQAQMGG